MIKIKWGIFTSLSGIITPLRNRDFLVSNNFGSPITNNLSFSPSLLAGFLPFYLTKQKFKHLIY